MNAAVLAVWMGFLAQATEPLPVITLDQAIEEAQKNNLDWKIAQARLQQAQEISRKVWAGYLPQIVASGSYQRNSQEATQAKPTGFLVRNVGGPSDKNGPAYDPSRPASAQNPPGEPSSDIVVPVVEDVVVQEKQQFGAQIQLSQAILVPALWPAIQNSYLTEEVVRLNTENARREILFGVARIYYGAASLKESIAVQQRLLENNLAHENDARIRVEAGASPRITLVRAQIDRARSEQDLIRVQNSYASAKIAMGTLLNRKEDFEVARPPEPSLPQESGNLEENAMNKRPDLQAAKIATRVAEKNLNGVYYKYLPNLVGSAAYRVSDVKGLTNTYDTWIATLSLNWTLWDGGLRESELRENRAEQIEAEANYSKMQAETRDEVRRSQLDWESARANLAKAQEQRTLAQENSRLVEVSFQAGAATQVEVSDAAIALSSAETNYVAETLNSQLALLKLLKAAGEFNPTH